MRPATLDEAAALVPRKRVLSSRCQTTAVNRSRSALASAAESRRHELQRSQCQRGVLPNRIAREHSPALAALSTLQRRCERSPG